MPDHLRDTSPFRFYPRPRLHIGQETQIQEATESLAKTRDQLTQLRDRFVTVRRKIEAAGLSNAMARLLRREYERLGIGLISLASGPDCLLSELGSGDKRNAQVILMRAEPAAMRSQSRASVSCASGSSAGASPKRK